MKPGETLSAVLFTNGEAISRLNLPNRRLPISPLRAFLAACCCLCLTDITTRGASAGPEQGEVLTREGQVDYSPARAAWGPAGEGQKLMVQDRLRTLAQSRATVRLAELGRLRVNQLTTIEVLPPKGAGGKALLDLKDGAFYFFTRGRPGEFNIQTPTANGASRGTEFLVEIEAAGRSVFTVFDGEVEVSNPLGTVLVTNRQQGLVEPGQPPVVRPILEAVNLVQWWLYYPGVLDVTELALPPLEKLFLDESLNHYRSGDLAQALATHPRGPLPSSEDETIYYAALLLSVGQVNEAQAMLNTVDEQSRLAGALRQVIASVTLKPFTEKAPPELATEWLAKSYYLQSQYKLQPALEAARRATKKSPLFGFAWARVAELEFGFGHAAEAKLALDKAIALSPRNAQALALRGFVLSAQNRLGEALRSFDDAIAVDGALGNAWLGRGLCRIRTGDAEAGRRDLQTAAALEPNRSLLRSYLGKAFSNAGEAGQAGKELELAERLDPNDPTPWLYSALLNRQENRVNAGVDDLEKSLDLNDNRRVYRSRLLLDQDRAVRSASLATIYQRDGMVDVSVREAARAVASDYGNHSAHLFLADSFNALRDPTRFNLRIETAWFNKLLLANLLAPVGAGSLSQHVTQQEYSKFFEANRLGFSTDSEVRSDGQFREIASQFGTFGNTSYSLDLEYQHNDGVRLNNELSRLEWYTTVKQQLTPQDSVTLLTKYQDYHSGDNFQYYDPTTNARPNFKFDEFQTPLVVGAYHHEWAPGVHTLLLGGRLINAQRLSDRAVNELVLIKDTNGVVQPGSGNLGFDVDYRSQFEIYTSELNQIIETERQNLVFGGRFQSGRFDTRARLTNPAAAAAFFNTPPDDARSSDDFERISAYIYETWKPIDNLFLTAGVDYDRITYPLNHRQPPISRGSTTRDRINPKAALIWSPRKEVTVRGIYTRSLGGVSFDESFRLEPTQLAGFNQSFRTLIPESLVGSVSAPTYDTWGAALDLKFPTRTYVGLQGELLQSRVDQTFGVFDLDSVGGVFTGLASFTPRQLAYEERSLAVTLNQLFSDEWALGAQYKFTRADLDSVFPLIPTSVIPAARSSDRADLHEVTLRALFNHPSGLFARGEAHWYRQQNANLPDEDFWQINLFAGLRFRQQRGELTVGVLNVADHDYRLNPLSAYVELPRERVLLARLKLNF
jgi:tetratricopeptide (TPR) repeat protein